MSKRDPSKRFHGKPCPRCHTTERYVKPPQVCCECARRASMAWAKGHPIETQEINRRAQRKRRGNQQQAEGNIDDLL